MKRFTTSEEIAQVIFNDPNPELNDLLRCILISRPYSAKQIFVAIASNINADFESSLMDELIVSKRREQFMVERVKDELLAYAAISGQLGKGSKVSSR
ncbi:hypothetical protein WBG78_24980 [Chryseolinea sp. T2]|uniref:hypothetical protein n=1 Tax=Chryseolinea sp. T2 TaxID=3129255 RepID=UPI003077052B